MAWKTRLTENGVLPEPNLRMVRLIHEVKATIHPSHILPPENRSKARIAVFASRKDIPEIWPFCSPDHVQLHCGARALRNAGLR